MLFSVTSKHKVKQQVEGEAKFETGMQSAGSFGKPGVIAQAEGENKT